MRRVVTGENPDGKSFIASDAEVRPLDHRKGGRLYRLWGSEEAPTLPSSGSMKEAEQLFPPPGGLRFTLATMAPRSEADLSGGVGDPNAEVITQKLGIADLYDKAHPGMHATETIDFVYIISGEVYMELDDGLEVKLKAGDTVVQNGTRHAWSNRSDEPCVMVVSCVGATRS